MLAKCLCDNDNNSAKYKSPAFRLEIARPGHFRKAHENIGSKYFKSAK